MDNEKKIFLVLKNIGVPRGISGYEYIKSALLMMLENDEPNALLSMTKVLYPEIAKKFNTKPTRIERCIRHAIERAFDNIQPKAIEEIFVNLDHKRSQPTNKEFFTSIIEYLNYSKIQSREDCKNEIQN